ncbi:RDD family protein [Beggiatoa leptomitoformis]|uniref:RDD family protein n=1 Tax=Beggiatoa leptomitoformis TaxID=288004 RepID=A0A2N9YI51_9GAMM|nr:RDD family protein [Beggiatoa leptomitoformis]ALG67597.1 RDD family protein [Beggiatoa leptomitoformis]AUI70170.1 RDD family protein [Beggiatoa leptomitoformis]
MSPCINPTEFFAGQPVSLARHVAVLVYESLLLFAVLFIAGLLVLPVTRGNPSIFYTLYLLLVSFGYFAWHWRKGCTLAMQAWRVKIRSVDGQRITWKQVVIRFTVAFLSIACCGLGFFWLLFDKQKRTWHDIASCTQLVHIPKSK